MYKKSILIIIQDLVSRRTLDTLCDHTTTSGTDSRNRFLRKPVPVIARSVRSKESLYVDVTPMATYQLPLKHKPGTASRQK